MKITIEIPDNAILFKTEDEFKEWEFENITKAKYETVLVDKPLKFPTWGVFLGECLGRWERAEKTYMWYYPTM